MYGGEFDGAAAFSGGGFMPSQATQTTDPFPSALSKHRDKQTLIPLNREANQQSVFVNVDKVNFLIDGVDVNNVKLVGMVLNKAERVTDVSFVLDDGTGRIDCNRWVHEAVDTKEKEAILEGIS
ncbi:putative replication factor A protein [Helianthus annuus]|nr:putative replication factor A protein [Helianthus annuus]